MNLEAVSCIRCVGNCKTDEDQATKTQKYGKTLLGKQRYKCTNCNKTFILNYSYKGYCTDLNKSIIDFTKEGLGI